MIHCIIFIIIINLSQNLDSYILNGCLKYYVLATGCYMSPQFFLLYHIQVHVWCLLYKKNSSRPTINLRWLPNSLIHQQHPCTIFQLVTGYKVHMFMPISHVFNPFQLVTGYKVHMFMPISHVFNLFFSWWLATRSTCLCPSHIFNLFFSW